MLGTTIPAGVGGGGENMGAVWEQMAELEANGDLNSVAGMELQRAAQEEFKAGQVAQFWKEEEAKNPLRCGSPTCTTM
jgi:hypothetical protein